MKSVLSTSLLLLFATLTFAQVLPRGFAKGEEAKMQTYLESFQNRSLACESIPDGASFRSMAEWEELEGLVITWTAFPGILTEITRAAQQELTVYIVTNNPTGVMNTLSNAGVSPNQNIEYITTPFNSIWVRDYGPNTVYQDGVGERAIVDWIYNRPRPQDDNVPDAVASLIGSPLYCTTGAPEDLVHTGGNYMSDGMGRAFSSELVLEENGPGSQWGISDHDEEAVDALMEKYMGISSYPKMENLPWDFIHHIDMHMKLLDEETLIVGQYPEGVADGPQIEANIQYLLNNFIAPSGNPYRIIRVPMPPDNFGDYPDQNGDYRTYANAVFLNKTIIVPTYEEQYDTTALRIWEEAMPGYTITGVNADAMIFLLGAIHCITKEVGVSEPLLVNHLRPRELCGDSTFMLTATSEHISGIQEMNLFHRVTGELEYEKNSMTQVPGTNEFFAELPILGNAGQDLEYYFEAVANNGKTINRPMPAPVGYFNVPLINCASVGTKETTNIAKEISIYPNPAAAITAVEFTLNENWDGQVALVNIHGQQVHVIHDGNLPVGKQQLFFDASELPGGMYFVNMNGKSGVKALGKVVVK